MTQPTSAPDVVAGPPPARAPDPLAPLMARLAQGDQTALRELYSATSAKLMGVCLRILSDRSESEDVLQELYLTAWKRASAFEPSRASAMAWLCAIARNRAIDRLRARQRDALAGVPGATEDRVDEAPGAEAGLGRPGEWARLHACLEGLKPEQGRAIRTAFLEGVTYEALAARADVPLGTMKSWVRRGLLRLRECLSS